MSTSRPHHRFSVDEYERLIECGILTEEDTVELIRGEVIEKLPVGPDHSSHVNTLTRLFIGAIRESVIVHIQNPVRFPDSEPEPDLCLLTPREDNYTAGHPLPSDVLLLIEVADSSLDTDRGVKRELYAESGIVEYWIVNLPDTCVEVHRQPTSQGNYGEVRTVPARGEQIETVAMPGFVVTVDQIV